MKKQSFRIKLLRIFLFAVVLILGVNLTFIWTIFSTIQQIDGTYSQNLYLNELSTTLEAIDKHAYDYLNTKSSEALVEYYESEGNYYSLMLNLNKDTSDDSTLLMEKNILALSKEYLDEVSEAIQYKRARDVASYSLSFEESTVIYNYLQESIGELNTEVFLKNSSIYSQLRELLDYLVWGSIGCLILIMLLTGVWIFVQTRKLTSPLIALSEAANEVANGNIELSFPVIETNDEVEVMEVAFNKMLESIREYIEKITENLENENKLVANELKMKSDLKEAQLKYLQAQINPHFLFNTLNAGAQLAMIEEADQTYKFIENMADFFRYNVKKFGRDTTIGEEIQLVRNYIYILNVRFADELNFTTKVDEALVECRMPGMVLQPIVENAVNHGLAECEIDKEISLELYRENDSVVISIQDNGIGISEENIQKIMTGSIVGKSEESGSTGIGISNVINRLRNYYSRTKVLEIIRNDVGTKVIVRIPADGATGGEYV